ncbi:MAG: hypothetical protein DLM61_13060 [Pseudonocardiales bacterium]|nr:MAG: hypothetical protein DLM61_13060 [Pseudonocardiales bacterium]
MSRAFVELADSLVDDYDIIELLQRLVGHSVELPAADVGELRERMGAQFLLVAGVLGLAQQLEP